MDVGSNESNPNDMCPRLFYPSAIIQGPSMNGLDSAPQLDCTYKRPPNSQCNASRYPARSWLGRVHSDINSENIGYNKQRSPVRMGLQYLFELVKEPLLEYKNGIE
jgi:hypothetical protein